MRAGLVAIGVGANPAANLTSQLRDAIELTCNTDADHRASTAKSGGDANSYRASAREQFALQMTESKVIIRV